MADDGDENTDVEVNVDIDFSLCEKKKLCDGQYHIVFGHPESLVSCKYGRSLLLSEMIYGRFVPHRFRPLPFRPQSVSSRTVSSPIISSRTN